MIERYDVTNVREFLTAFIGTKVLDITQSDADDERGCFVALMFENGATLTFPIGDEGFQWELP